MMFLVGVVIGFALGVVLRPYIQAFMDGLNGEPPRAA
jgi:hypothetical protein